MRVTLNENCGHLQDYPAEIIGFVPPHFFDVRAEGCKDAIRLSPGHFVEGAEVVRNFKIAVAV